VSQVNVSESYLLIPAAFPIIQKANPEDLAGRMLPAGLMPSGARFVAACFWSFLCIIDGKATVKLPLSSLIFNLQTSQKMVNARIALILPSRP
jgi:hypothetical protein